jgi:transcriptional regulator with XRE-family HTH domain
MLADRLKAMREAKSWSQGHLADAARLNIRTVQRIEAGDPASRETLLSLAAALDVRVSELEPDARLWSGPTLSPSRVALGAIFVFPAVLFIVVNLLRSIGMGGPFDFIARVGGKLMSFEAFNLVSPVIFLGGAAAAIVICAPALIRLRTTRVGRAGVSINAIELRAGRAALVVAAAAILAAGTLLTYAALELLHTPRP